MYAGGHELEGDFVADAVADDDGYVDEFQKFGESQSALALGYVARGGDGGLNDDDVRSGLGGERGEFLGGRGGKRNGALRAAFLYLLDPLSDKLLSKRGGVNLLEYGGHLSLRGFDYLGDYALRVFVAAVDAFHVGYGHSAKPVHRSHETWGGYRVHRSAQDGGRDGYAVH